MATAPTLTPTEVIDRVRAARRAAQAAAVEEPRWPWSGRGCTPAPPRRPRRAGARPTCTTKAWSRSPVPVPPGSRSSHPSPRRRARDQPGRGPRRRRALELARRLPRLWERVVAGAVPVWRARLIARETTDLSPAGGAVRGPADRRHPAPDPSCPGRPPGPGSPAVLRPRPRARRRRRGPRQASHLAAPRRRPGDHRHHDDPGHPRARFFSTRPSPASPATSASSATPRPSRSAEPVRSDPRRSPVRSGPALRT